eukprot:Skav216263  [mRNA]  locus=scaffold1544:190:2429:- [translate_table: standard]
MEVMKPGRGGARKFELYPYVLCSRHVVHCRIATSYLKPLPPQSCPDITDSAAAWNDSALCHCMSFDSLRTIATRLVLVVFD